MRADIHPNDYFSSFEGFKPFNADRTPKKGVIFAEWQQSKTRTAVMAYGGTKDAFWFPGDRGVSLSEAAELLAVKIMPAAEYEKIYKAKLVKAAAKINKNIDRFWAKRDPSFIVNCLPPCGLDDMKIDLSSAEPVCFNEKEFLRVPNAYISSYKRFRIKRSWGEFDYYGTGDYVRGELTKYPSSIPSPPFTAIAWQRYGLKAIRSPLAPNGPLTSKSDFSLFGWSVSGGVGCDDVAINLAAGVVVPLDDTNDISLHKKGWSYAYKYMGQYGITGEMVIMRKDGILDLGLQDELIELVGNGDYKAGLKKIVRYLCALMVLSGWDPDDQIELYDLDREDVEKEVVPREVLSAC